MKFKNIIVFSTEIIKNSPLSNSEKKNCIKKNLSNFIISKEEKNRWILYKYLFLIIPKRLAKIERKDSGHLISLTSGFLTRINTLTNNRNGEFYIFYTCISIHFKWGSNGFQYERNFILLLQLEIAVGNFSHLIARVDQLESNFEKLVCSFIWDTCLRAHP